MARKLWYVSQQRRGVKSQSGFMIFSQRHLSRAIFPRPKNDERAKAASSLMSHFLRALRMMHRCS